MSERIILGSDHAGLALRVEVAKAVGAAGFEVDDLGPFTTDRVDYPDYARKVCEAVQQGRGRFGVLVCGTGIGMSMAANKLRGIRAAHCANEYDARMARAHNDANVLCLGERVVGPGLAASIVAAFLATPFEGGRHAERVAKITALER